MHRHVSQDLAQVCLRRPMGFGEPAACVPPLLACALWWVRMATFTITYHWVPFRVGNRPHGGGVARCIMGEA